MRSRDAGVATTCDCWQLWIENHLPALSGRLKFPRVLHLRQGKAVGDETIQFVLVAPDQLEHGVAVELVVPVPAAVEGEPFGNEVAGVDWPSPADRGDRALAACALDERIRGEV